MQKREKLNLGLGMRTTKTAVAVMICVATLHYLNLQQFRIFQNMEPFTSFYAGTAAVICMQSTVENTVKRGLTRIISTLVGGAVGVALLGLDQLTGWKIPVYLFVGLGVYICISICNITKRPDACAIACVVLMAVFISHSADDRYLYAVFRMVETAFGIVVAIVVNKYLAVPRFLRKREKLTAEEAAVSGEIPENRPALPAEQPSENREKDEPSE